MRTIPPELLNRVKKKWQVPAENAEPKMKILLSRGFLNELFQVFTIQEGAELTDVDVTVRRPDTTALPAEAFAIAINNGVAEVKSKPLPYDDQIPWVDEFILEADSENAVVIEDTFVDGALSDVVISNGVLELDSASIVGSNQIPTMTSNTTPSGTASANQEFSSSYQARHAMDANASTYWSNTSGFPAWIAYEFTENKIINQYSIKARADASNGAPKNWTFEGWDGFAWQVLDTQSNISFTNGERKEFAIANTNAYVKYQINISANNGRTTTNIAEIEMLTASAVTYQLEGYRITPAVDISLLDDAETSIEWLATTPQNTSVKIYVGYNTSDSTPPGTWHECANGQLLPFYPINPSGQYLWIKQVLATSDTSITPTLSEVITTISVAGSIAPITNVESVAIEFDGYWDRDYNTRRFNFVTDDYPWIFYVKGGNLYAQYWQDEPTIIATDVTKVAVIRGWVPVAGDTTNDQGLIVSYLKSDGTMWYKGYCIQSDGSKAWDIGREITELTSEGEITDLALFRTNDFRVGFMAEIDGEIWWTLTERNYAGMSYWPELLTGKFGGFTTIDLIEIEYLNLFAADEHLTGSYATLCIGLNQESDVVGICTGAEITGDSELTLGFSQPLTGNIARIKDLITISNEAMTVYYTPISTEVGETQNELVITVAELLDTENAVKVTVGDATIYLAPSGVGSMLSVAPFCVTALLVKDPYHLVNLTGRFGMTTVALTEILRIDTANQEAASLTGKFGGFTQIVLTKVGTGDV